MRIVRMFTSLPKTAEASVLGKQVLRSGTSIGTNYREAYRSRSRAEFIAKAGDCLKELEETAYWLELLTEGRIVDEMHLDDLRKECDELTAIFVTIINRSKQNAKNKEEGRVVLSWFVLGRVRKGWV
jgi:four helix bundle protein